MKFGVIELNKKEPQRGSIIIILKDTPSQRLYCTLGYEQEFTHQLVLF
jgi:hypothetical protein